MFLQKLLDAHEEQNVDSYTEAVSGWQVAALLRHALPTVSTCLTLALAPGCEFFSVDTPESRNVAPRGTRSILPILEMMALRLRMGRG